MKSYDKLMICSVVVIFFATLCLVVPSNSYITISDFFYIVSIQLIPYILLFLTVGKFQTKDMADVNFAFLIITVLCNLALILLMFSEVSSDYISRGFLGAFCIFAWFVAVLPLIAIQIIFNAIVKFKNRNN